MPADWGVRPGRRVSVMGAFVCGTFRLRLLTETLLLKPEEPLNGSVKLLLRLLAALFAVAALTDYILYGSY